MKLTNSEYFEPSTPDALARRWIEGRDDYRADRKRDETVMSRDEREAYARGWLYAQRG